MKSANRITLAIGQEVMILREADEPDEMQVLGVVMRVVRIDPAMGVKLQDEVDTEDSCIMGWWKPNQVVVLAEEQT